MILFFFFFQAEDGIRDWSVTGVQTCALPISGDQRDGDVDGKRLARHRVNQLAARRQDAADRLEDEVDDRIDLRERDERSEERRVGKECRCRWSRCHEKKKTSKVRY